jgi:hypothetical protein
MLATTLLAIIADLQQTFEVLVLPKHCLQLILEDATANPFAPSNASITNTHQQC